MQLCDFDQKYVCLKDIYGDTFYGVAVHHSSDYCFHEYGEDEDAIQIEDYLIYESQIESIEEVKRHGTAEIWTDRLILRRYRLDDAEELYEVFGKDPAMSQYSGWNPYATPEMTKETVLQMIAGYGNEHSYAWVLDNEGVLVGTIGAYDYKDNSIEVGFSIRKSWWGRGYATEALTTVLEYLTKNEGISCVTAWCAADNIGSRRVLEKSGMQLVRTEENGLAVEDKTYDKLVFEYRG